MGLSDFYTELDRLYGESGSDVEGFLRKVLRRARLAGDKPAEVASANELGSVLRLRGDLAEAEWLYDTVVRLLESMDVGAEDRARALVNLGDVYVARGRFAAAVDTFDATEALLGDEDGHQYEMSAICNNRSSALRGMNRFAEAHSDLRRAGRLLETVPGSDGVRATNAINLAQVLMDEGRVEEAAEVIVGALVIYETLNAGRDVHRPHALATAARIAYLRGDYVRAGEFYRMAAKVLREKLGDVPYARLLEEKARDMCILASGGLCERSEGEA